MPSSRKSDFRAWQDDEVTDGGITVLGVDQGALDTCLCSERAAVWRWSSREEIPHAQGQRKSSKMVGAGAAVRRYPTPKVRESPVRW